MRNDPTGPADPGPEFRRDPVAGWWVVVAPGRAGRPTDADEAPPRDRAAAESGPCPFCPGREHDTPHEVFAVRDPGTPPDGPGWRLRVVPNKFPAVRPGPAGGPGDDDAAAPGLFDRRPAAGRHEVVIESAAHVTNPADLPDDLFRATFVAYRDRLVALAADPALRYAAAFKNVGAEAGASLAHVHSQVVATPHVPDLVARELRGAAGYHARTGRCVFCDLVARERADGRRVVAETAGFVAVAAFAPRFAYEVWVLPKEHASRYEAATAAALADLAGMMKGVVRAVDRAVGRPAYNWFLHAAPLRAADLPHYHWHFEVVPRTSRPAGLEWGAGCFVTTVAPEAAAADLRRAWGG